MQECKNSRQQQLLSMCSTWKKGRKDIKNLPPSLRLLSNCSLYSGLSCRLPADRAGQRSTGKAWCRMVRPLYSSPPFQCNCAFWFSAFTRACLWWGTKKKSHLFYCLSQTTHAIVLTIVPWSCQPKAFLWFCPYRRSPLTSPMLPGMLLSLCGPVILCWL